MSLQIIYIILGFVSICAWIAVITIIRYELRRRKGFWEGEYFYHYGISVDDCIFPEPCNCPDCRLLRKHALRKVINYRL